MLEIYPEKKPLGLMEKAMKMMEITPILMAVLKMGGRY
jgi:hypothetical protein